MIQNLTAAAINADPILSTGALIAIAIVGIGVIASIGYAMSWTSQ